MIHGSMTHYSSGRKKNYNAWSSKKTTPDAEFKPLVQAKPYRRQTKHYESVSVTTHNNVDKPALSNKEKLEISAGYTVAPAYNKGAYQVIPRDQVENIGR
jgi:hypothetical protein